MSLDPIRAVVVFVVLLFSPASLQARTLLSVEPEDQGVDEPAPPDLPIKVHPHLEPLLSLIGSDFSDQVAYFGNDLTGRPVLDWPNDDPPWGALQNLIGRELDEPAPDGVGRVRELLVRAPRPAGAQRDGAFARGEWRVIPVPDRLTPRALERLIEAEGLAGAYVEPNFEGRPLPTSGPTDPTLLHPFPSELSILDVWGLIAIGAPQAWSRVQGSREVIVAVLDSGVHLKHRDLRRNLWSGRDASGQEISGYSYVGGAVEPQDDYGHGTHAAGIIGAVGNNGYGTAGVCWRVTLLPIKVITKDNRVVGQKWVGDAIQRAVNEGARVISNSWGFPVKSEYLEEALRYADQKGVLVVAAISNDGREAYPAAYELDNIIRVMAVNELGERSTSTQFGVPEADIAAPGVAIYAPITPDGPGCDNVLLQDRDCPCPKKNAGEPCLWAYQSGTSTAAPFVAGAAALLLSTKTYGGMRPKDLKEMLIRQARPSRTRAPILDISFVARVPDLQVTGELTMVQGGAHQAILAVDLASFKLSIPSNLMKGAQGLDGRQVVVSGTTDPAHPGVLQVYRIRKR